MGHVAHRRRPLGTAKNHCRSMLAASWAPLFRGAFWRAAAQCPGFRTKRIHAERNSGLRSLCQRIHAYYACSRWATRRSSSTPAASDWSSTCTEMHRNAGNYWHVGNDARVRSPCVRSSLERLHSDVRRGRGLWFVVCGPEVGMCERAESRPNYCHRWLQLTTARDLQKCWQPHAIVMDDFFSCYM